MSRLKIVGVVAVAAVLSAAAVAWYAIRRGFTARAEPSSIEALVAATARKLAVPSSDRQRRNPYTASPENIRAGMEHFADHCAVCHGNDGGGDTTFGKGLYPKPPDLRARRSQEKTDGELYYTIENGVRLSGMPAFGEQANPSDISTWHLVLFIRHLPHVTSAELDEMERLNPKTEKEREEELEEEEFLRGGNPHSQSSEIHQH